MEGFCFICYKPISWKRNKKYCSNKCKQKRYRLMRWCRRYAEAEQMTLEDWIHKGTATQLQHKG